MVREQEETMDVDVELGPGSLFVGKETSSMMASRLVRSSSHTFANTRGHLSAATTNLLKCAELPMYSYHSGLLFMLC